MNFSCENSAFLFQWGLLEIKQFEPQCGSIAAGTEWRQPTGTKQQQAWPQRTRSIRTHQFHAQRPVSQHCHELQQLSHTGESTATLKKPKDWQWFGSPDTSFVWKKKKRKKASLENCRWTQKIRSFAPISMKQAPFQEAGFAAGSPKDLHACELWVNGNWH